MYADNIYENYQSNLYTLERAIDIFVDSGKDMLKQAETKNIDTLFVSANLVPRIRSSQYYFSDSESPNEKLPFVVDHLAGDLDIYYVIDQPKSMLYVLNTMLPKMHISPDNIKKLAIKNFTRLYPNFQLVIPKYDYYQMSANGDYDASILLVDKVWEEIVPKITHSSPIIIAIPAKDKLLIAKYHNKEYLQKFRKMAQQMYQDDAYRISNKLFVRHNHRWQEYRQTN